MRSAWICTRNDVLGNCAVLLAALGVFGTCVGLPDALVAGIMASLALQGAATVLRAAWGELRDARIRPSLGPHRRSCSVRHLIARVVHMTLHEKPPATTHWSVRKLAKVVGLSPSSVQRPLMKEVSGRDHDPRNERGRARKQQKVDDEPGHDTLPIHSPLSGGG